MRPTATPVPDGWPPPLGPQGPWETEPGVQADSSAAACGFSPERASDLRRRPFPSFQRLAASGGEKSLGSPSDTAETAADTTAFRAVRNGSPSSAYTGHGRSSAGLARKSA
jgi:hypothetical protein